MSTNFPLKEIMAAVDARNTQRFVAFLTEDAVFRYGSQPPVQGRTAIGQYVTGIFSTIASLEHRILDTWERDGSLVCQGEVTYTRHDRRMVTVPFVNVFRLVEGRVREYLIYVDPTPLSS